MTRHACIVLALTFAAATARGDAPCVPVARVSGEPALVDAVVGVLRTRGLRVGGAARCGDLRAEVTTDERGGVRVVLIDDQERTVERFAADATGASTVIESWVRRDVAAPLLAARPDLARPHAPAPAPVAIAAPARATSPRRIELGGAAELALGSDGGVWRGVRLHGCVQAGPLCVGGLVRYASDSGQRGRSHRLETTRSTVDVVLAADLPVDRGQLGIVPGVGVGQASFRSTREIMGEADSDTLVTLIARAHVDVRWRFRGAWSLGLDAAAVYAPLVETVIDDDDDDPDPPVAGGARLAGSLGVGLAYGGL